MPCSYMTLLGTLLWTLKSLRRERPKKKKKNPTLQCTRNGVGYTHIHMTRGIHTHRYTVTDADRDTDTKRNRDTERDANTDRGTYMQTASELARGLKKHFSYNT